ncbi:MULTISPECIES: hypothetical protein [Bacillaceae]|uniref:hypothetical protein n=1 Tax=Bacillaceae TaxID=186817 RepID=UPI001E2C0EBC|nr:MULTISPECIES: hypothetical protein [Bacillaceae]MCE4051393.1 hypothetical protein [Bacillus sp. Au-Bac7]MCM3034215.1 hypothetical protein [Niallia sp. MER 6]UPO89996.1 hypothetical protein L8T27_024845 [Niallia sp. Man26]
MKRFLTATLSVVLFAILYSCVFYVPDFGFFWSILFASIFAGPIYYLIGIPISLLIDIGMENIVIESKKAKYFLVLGMYSIAGIFAGVIFFIIWTQSFLIKDAIIFSIIGIIASNIYFHLSLLLSKVRLKPIEHL